MLDKILDYYIYAFSNCNCLGGPLETACKHVG